MGRDGEPLVGGRARSRVGCARKPAAPNGDEFAEVLDEPATERMVHHLDSMVASSAAMASRCSTCWATGRFRHLDLMVDRRVLIPRPETEQVWSSWRCSEHAVRGRSL